MARKRKKKCEVYQFKLLNVSGGGSLSLIFDTHYGQKPGDTWLDQLYLLYGLGWPYMVWNSAGPAGSSWISIHIWGRCLPRNQSTDGILCKQPVDRWLTISAGGYRWQRWSLWTSPIVQREWFSRPPRMCGWGNRVVGSESSMGCFKVCIKWLSLDVSSEGFW